MTIVLQFLKGAVDAIVASIIATIIYSKFCSINNTHKTKKMIAKIKDKYLKVKQYFLELCNNSFLITTSCLTAQYKIDYNCYGGYNSILCEIESQGNYLKKLIKYSFVKDQVLDEIIDAIDVYEWIHYNLLVIRSPLNFKKGFAINVQKDFEKLDKFFKIK